MHDLTSSGGCLFPAEVPIPPALVCHSTIRKGQGDTNFTAPYSPSSFLITASSWPQATHLASGTKPTPQHLWPNKYPPMTEISRAQPGPQHGWLRSHLPVPTIAFQPLNSHQASIYPKPQLYPTVVPWQHSSCSSCEWTLTWRLSYWIILLTSQW